MNIDKQVHKRRKLCRRTIQSITRTLVTCLREEECKVRKLPNTRILEIYIVDDIGQSRHESCSLRSLRKFRSSCLIRLLVLRAFDCYVPGGSSR